MQAGVTKFKNCNNFFDCTTCKFDLGMKRQVEKGRQILADSGLNLTTAKDLKDAASKVAQLVA